MKPLPISDLASWLTALTADPAIARLLQLGGLVIGRVLPLVVLTPIFGGPAVSPRLRFGIAAAFAAALVPGLYSAERPLFGTLMYVALLLKEGLVGLTLAVAVIIIFQTFAVFGSLVDQVRGEGQATVYDPHVDHRETVLSTFSLQFAVVLFLTIGGQRILFNALGDSFLAIRPEALSLGGLGGPRGIAVFIGLVGRMLAVALCLAGPALIVTILADLSLALIGRVAQQIEVSFVSLGLKSMVMIWLLVVSFATLLRSFDNELAQMAGRLRAMFG